MITLMIGFSLVLVLLVAGFSYALGQALKSHVLVVNKVIDQYMGNKANEVKAAQASQEVDELKAAIKSATKDLRYRQVQATSSVDPVFSDEDRLIAEQAKLPNKKETVHIEGFGDVEIQSF